MFNGDLNTINQPASIIAFISKLLCDL